MHIDSNLPDVRLAIGRPDENHFVASVLDAADARLPSRARPTARVVRAGARCGCPTTARPGRARNEPITDLRGARDLPVLIVAGAGSRSDRGCARRPRRRPRRRGHRRRPAGRARRLDRDHRGLHGGDPQSGHARASTSRPTAACTSRSCARAAAGRPGVWIDPPRRSTPDGANFQFQHWSHTFEYAIAAGAGDWREGGIVRAGHDFNNPLVARSVRTHPGQLPATRELRRGRARVGRPDRPQAGRAPAVPDGRDGPDPAAGVALRVYELSGRPTEATIRSRWPIRPRPGPNAPRAETRSPRRVRIDARRCDSSRTRSHHRGGPIEDVAAEAETGEARARPAGRGRPAGLRRLLAPQQGCGPDGLPTGHRPDQAVVHSPARDRSGRRSSSPRNGPTAHVRDPSQLIVPPGWESTPTGTDLSARSRRAPRARGSRATPSAEAAARPLLRRRPDHGRRRPVTRGRASRSIYPSGRWRRNPGRADGPALPLDGPLLGGGAGADDRGPRTRGPATQRRSDPRSWWRASRRVGGRGDLRRNRETRRPSRCEISNSAASEVRGEAQVLSPLETWSTITPWTQGFTVEPGSDTVIGFDVAPPRDAIPGSYWALVKVMYFGRLLYTESVEVTIEAP